MAICSVIYQQQVWQEREQLLSCFCDLFCLDVCMLGSVHWPFCRSQMNHSANGLASAWITLSVMQTMVPILP